jgi:hypothetical protein
MGLLPLIVFVQRSKLTVGKFDDVKIVAFETSIRSGGNIGLDQKRKVSVVGYNHYLKAQ